MERIIAKLSKEFGNTYEGNDYIEYEDVVLLVLEDSNKEFTGVCIIDSEDYDLVYDTKWRLTPQGYVRNGYSEAIHNRIMQHKPSFAAEVDHINRNKQDNRKSNLRIVDRRQNNYNCGLSKNNTSNHVGVSLHKPTGKWRAYIMYNYEHKHLGLFEDREDAIKARKEAEEIYYNK